MGEKVDSLVNLQTLNNILKISGYVQKKDSKSKSDTRLEITYTTTYLRFNILQPLKSNKKNWRKKLVDPDNSHLN